MDWIIWMVLGLAVLVVLIPLLLGLALSAQQRATRVELIKAPINDVWLALSDLNRQTEWRTDLRGMQLRDDDEGMRWVETPKSGSPLVVRKIKEIPPREIIVQLEKASRPCGTRQAVLHHVPGGTRVTFTETAEIHNPLKRLANQMTSALDKRLNEYIRQFKARFTA